jgi:hypothetical protein
VVTHDCGVFGHHHSKEAVLGAKGWIGSKMVDLNLLESDKNFQQMCFRLARKEYPRAIALASDSWEGGATSLTFEVRMALSFGSAK